MSTKAYRALQKQVQILTNGRQLSNLNLRLLEIALEGMNVPTERRTEAIQNAIQLSRDQIEKRRAKSNGGSDASP